MRLPLILSATALISALALAEHKQKAALRTNHETNELTELAGHYHASLYRRTDEKKHASGPKEGPSRSSSSSSDSARSASRPSSPRHGHEPDPDSVLPALKRLRIKVPKKATTLGQPNGPILPEQPKKSSLLSKASRGNLMKLLKPGKPSKNNDNPEQSNQDHAPELNTPPSPGTETIRELNWIAKGKWPAGQRDPFKNHPSGMTGEYTRQMRAGTSKASTPVHQSNESPTSNLRPMPDSPDWYANAGNWSPSRDPSLPPEMRMTGGWGL